MMILILFRRRDFQIGWMKYWWENVGDKFKFWITIIEVEIQSDFRTYVPANQSTLLLGQWLWIASKHIFKLYKSLTNLNLVYLCSFCLASQILNPWFGNENHVKFGFHIFIVFAHKCHASKTHMKPI